VKPIHWETLYRNNAPKLKALCRRYVGDAALADDLVQETFVTAIEKAGTFRNSGAIEGWIRKIAINKALQYLREQQHLLSLDEVNYQAVNEIVMEQSRNTIRAAIESASFSSGELLTVIDHLPVHHKMVFNLYVMEGYSHQQIAELLNISLGTSKSHLARARKKAQELLYTEAQEKQPLVQQHKLLWLLLWFRPGRPVDHIFRQGLKGFEMETSIPAFVQNTAPIKAISWATGMAGKALIYGTSTTIIAGSIWLATSKLKSDDLQTINHEIPAFVFAADSAQNNQTDSLTIDITATEKEPLTETNTNLTPSHVQPVIIKKTIVIRDTVRIEKSTLHQ
jgi:RNA polymerase sigma factor (sigma-70 family)